MAEFNSPRSSIFGRYCKDVGRQILFRIVQAREICIPRLHHALAVGWIGIGSVEPVVGVWDVLYGKSKHLRKHPIDVVNVPLAIRDDAAHRQHIDRLAEHQFASDERFFGLFACSVGQHLGHLVGYRAGNGDFIGVPDARRADVFETNDAHHSAGEADCGIEHRSDAIWGEVRRAEFVCARVSARIVSIDGALLGECGKVGGKVSGSEYVAGLMCVFVIQIQVVTAQFCGLIFQEPHACSRHVQRFGYGFCQKARRCRYVAGAECRV